MIYKINDKTYYMTNIHPMIAFEIAKKFGLEILYDDFFKDLLQHLDELIFQEKIRKMLEKDEILELNEIIKNLDRRKRYILNKIASQYGLKFNYDTNSFEKIKLNMGNI